MALYDEILKEVGPPPEAPGDRRFLGWSLNRPEQEAYKNQLRIWQQMADQEVKQRMNPLRDTNLGQISALMGLPADQLATPEQMRAQERTEPSQVPSFRFAPEPGVLNTPMARLDGGLVPRTTQLQGPPDVRQEEGGPVEWRYPSRTDLVPQPQVMRPAQGPIGPSPMEPQVRSPQGFQPIGSFQAQPGPDLTYQTREPNLEAPTTRYQQMLGMSGVERESRWPRGMSTSGNMQLRQEAAQQFMALDTKRRSGIPLTPAEEAQWQTAGAVAGVFGRTAPEGSMEYAKGQARTQDYWSGMDARERRLAETERHNKFRESLDERRFSHTERWHASLQQAMQNKDWATVERLQEARYRFDQLMLRAGAIDKAGMFDDAQKEAFEKGLGIVEGLSEGKPASPEEMSWFERIFGAAPRYQYTPRSPIQAPTGGLPSMGRSGAAGGSTSTQGVTPPTRTQPGKVLTPEEEAELQQLRKEFKGR